MKHYILGALLLAGFSAKAQAPAAALPIGVAQHYQYVVLIMEGAADPRPYLQYGQDGKPAVTNAELEQENTVIRKIGSGIAALNYLCNRGWEIVAVTPRSSGGGGAVSTTFYYLLRKPTP